MIPTSRGNKFNFLWGNLSFKIQFTRVACLNRQFDLGKALSCAGWYEITKNIGAQFRVKKVNITEGFKAYLKRLRDFDFQVKK